MSRNRYPKFAENGIKTGPRDWSLAIPKPRHLELAGNVSEQDFTCPHAPILGDKSH